MRVGTLLALAVTGALPALDGCAEQRTDGTPDRNPCTACHGSSLRPVGALEQAAPPIDLRGLTATSSPGVGAHEIHLRAAETHGKVACTECHRVPDSVESPGHADDAYPAETVFGSLAKLGDRSPVYDFSTRTCASTYCHRDANPHWTAPRTSSEACGTCHSLPPSSAHPQAPYACSTCHVGVIDAQAEFLAPERHVDGKLDLPDACNGCHGNPQPDQAASLAPPRDLSGNVEPSSIGVGAHQAHLSGGKFSRPVACSECHEVPVERDDQGHLDDTLHAEVRFSGIAATAGNNPNWDRAARSCASTWCHGPSAPGPSPEWTRTDGPLGCTDCHGMPPPPPHLQQSDCALCHGNVVAADNLTIEDRALHVNGEVELAFPDTCNACHGGPTSNAPPPDVAGNWSNTARGVGAHATHLLDPQIPRRRIDCNDCHLVPTSVADPGHLDTPLPAEVTFEFSSVASVRGDSATPASWDPKNLTCSAVWCHGGRTFWDEDFGGSVKQWTWTASGLVDGDACNQCHGFPPPSHTWAVGLECGYCHSAVIEGWKSFIRPELHINGLLDTPPH